MLASGCRFEELRARLQESGQSGAESRVLYFDAEDLLLELRHYHAGDTPGLPPTPVGSVIQRPARDPPRIVQCME